MDRTIIRIINFAHIFRHTYTLNIYSFSKLTISVETFAILPDADDLAQGRTRARLPACRCTHVRNRGRTCVRSRERKGFAFRFEHDSSGRIFFKINLLSAVSVSFRHRLPRIAYARFSPPRMQPTHESRILLCLARRHVCPVSDVFRQLCAKDKEKNEWE